MLIDLLAIASRLVHKGKIMGHCGFEGQTILRNLSQFCQLYFTLGITRTMLQPSAYYNSFEASCVNYWLPLTK